MTDELQNHIEKELDERIIKFSILSGGDISNAYKVNTAINSFFIKCNASPNALDMFEKEALGLNLIRQTNTIKTPDVISYGSFNGHAYLILEHIESKSASSNDFQRFGEQLAKLHICTSKNFGLNTDNFIGRLQQTNSFKNDWLGFYTDERLIPQLSLSKRKGLLSERECPSTQEIKNRLYVPFEGIRASLLHGDLWGGNYLISKDGTPYLIDPAVYYGHNEVDIAMSKLFGGFGKAFYEAYHAIIPEDEHTNVRMEIYQLYYLLIHLNMFGSSYYRAVKRILNRYF